MSTKRNVSKIVAGAAAGFFGLMYVRRFGLWLMYGERPGDPDWRGSPRERARLQETVDWHQQLLAEQGFAPGYGIQESGALGVEGTAEWVAEMEAGSIEAAEAAAAAGAAGDGARARYEYTGPDVRIRRDAPRAERIRAIDVEIPTWVKKRWTPSQRRGGVRLGPPPPRGEDH